MRKILFCIALPFFLGVSTLAQNNLQCIKPSVQPGELSNGMEPRSAQEVARLQHSPHGAKRPSKHQLEIGWTGGKAVFKDNPPYNEPLDGLWWVYCGYSSTLEFHLVGKGDQGLFTGVLLDDKTGSRLPGGEAVLFSPDRQYYLAYEQPDGQDGETLRLYKRDGTAVWKGYNGILSRDGKSVVVDSENMRDMRFDGQNRPQATVHLDGGRTLVVTLTQTSNGKRDWLPHVQR